MARSTHSVEGPSPSGLKRHSLAWSLLALLLIVGVVIAGLYSLQSPERKLIVCSYLLPPDSVYFNSYRGRAAQVIISPDGRQVAFVGYTSRGSRMLYVQSLGEFAAHQLLGTEGASYPFWSPDNKFIGFFSGGKLKKVSTNGNPPVTICSIGDSRGASWGSDGKILFTPGPGDPLYAVSEGGTPVVVTKLDSSRHENSHRRPYFLPDGKHFFYYARTENVGGEAEGDAIYVASLDMTLNKIILNASLNVAYSSGFLLFMNKGTLMAQRFDVDALELKGEAIPIAESVRYDESYGQAVFAVSHTGVLVYQTGGESNKARLLVVDRDGKDIGYVGQIEDHITPRFSPDGKYVAVAIYDTKSHHQNLWVYDLKSGRKGRLTSGVYYEEYPIWSPDGRRIIYGAYRHGNYTFYEKATDGIGKELILYEHDGLATTDDWSPDGKYVLFDKIAGIPAKSGIWVLRLDSGNQTFPFLRTEFNQSGARFSPDGKWVAYTSDETGKNEVYVRPFPGPGPVSRLSLAGGFWPRWQGNGNELYYVNNEFQVMVVHIRVKGSTIEANRLRQLFKAPMSLTYYDVSSDGNRFVMSRSGESEVSTPIRIVQNWDSDLNK